MFNLTINAVPASTIIVAAVLPGWTAMRQK